MIKVAGNIKVHVKSSSMFNKGMFHQFYKAKNYPQEYE